MALDASVIFADGAVFDDRFFDEFIDVGVAIETKIGYGFVQLMRMVGGVGVVALGAPFLHGFVRLPYSLLFLIEFIVAGKAEFGRFIDQEVFLIAGMRLVADDAGADGDGTMHEFLVHVIVAVTGLAQAFGGVLRQHEFIIRAVRIVAAEAVAFHDGSMNNLIEFEGVATLAEFVRGFGEAEDVILDGEVVVATEAFELGGRAVHDFSVNDFGVATAGGTIVEAPIGLHQCFGRGGFGLRLVLRILRLGGAPHRGPNRQNRSSREDEGDYRERLSAIHGRQIHDLHCLSRIPGPGRADSRSFLGIRANHGPIRTRFSGREARFLR